MQEERALRFLEKQQLRRQDLQGSPKALAEVSGDLSPTVHSRLERHG